MAPALDASLLTRYVINRDQEFFLPRHGGAVRTGGSEAVRSDLQRTALRKLLQLDAATRLETLNVPPGNRLEALRGDRKGRHSIRVNDQWRIRFRWENGNAFDVEIVDYH